MITDALRESRNEAQRRYRATERGRQVEAAKFRRRYAKRRALVDSIKLERGCADCGYNAHPAALDFDHIRGEKLFEIGPRVAHAALPALLAEIEKCDVVCANCHRVRTADRRAT